MNLQGGRERVWRFSERGGGIGSGKIRYNYVLRLCCTTGNHSRWCKYVHKVHLLKRGDEAGGPRGMQELVL